MARLPAEVVRDGLKVYAERGIFQEFRETQGRHGKTRFEFRLLDDPVTVELAERDHTLVIRNMLRQVPAAMYADLQQFLAALFDRDLPPHRRLDRRSADARFVRRTRAGFARREGQARQVRVCRGKARQPDGLGADPPAAVASGVPVGSGRRVGGLARRAGKQGGMS